MKRAILLSVLFSCGSLLADNSVPAPPQRPGVLDEIVHMSQAGAPEDTVLAYAQAHRAELPSRLSDADLQWLRQAGVGERTVRYLRAVDVRIPEGAGQQGYSYGPSGPMPPRYVGQQYPAPPPSEAYDQGYPNPAYPDNSMGYDAATSPYGDNGFYDFWYTPYFNAYPYASYPYYAYPYYYPYYPYYAFHGHGHGHGDHVDHHGGHGNWGNGNGHNSSADSWRSRGSVAQRNGTMTMGPRGQGSQAYARGNVAAAPRGYRGNTVARGSIVGRGAPAMARSGVSRGAAPARPRGGSFGGGSRGGGHASGGSSGGHGRR